MSSNELDIVKKLAFVPGEADTDAAAWEMAKACLILGQYEKALLEFNRLIDNKYKLVASAKNVLRCCIGMYALDDAIAKYHEWCLSNIFSLDQLENIRTFLQEILYKKNINTLLSKPRAAGVNDEHGAPDDEYIDIIAVKLGLNGDSSEKMETMLEVTNQKGDSFNVVVPQNNQAMLDYLKIGKEIENLEKKTVEVCISGVEKGRYNGALTYHAQSTGGVSAGVGTWLWVNIGDVEENYKAPFQSKKPTVKTTVSEKDEKAETQQTTTKDSQGMGGITARVVAAEDKGGGGWKTWIIIILIIVIM